MKVLRKEGHEMTAKIDDLENRSRRNNLVFHGLPEVHKENCQEVINDLLTRFVGLAPDKFQIERCHRTPSNPTARAENGRGPRIIHVAFASYMEKEVVRKACVNKFKSEKYKESKLFVSDDFSKRVLSMRKDKIDTFKRLKTEGKRPFFLYPDRLGYRSGDGKLHLVA